MPRVIPAATVGFSLVALGGLLIYEMLHLISLNGCVAKTTWWLLATTVKRDSRRNPSDVLRIEGKLNEAMIYASSRPLKFG